VIAGSVGAIASDHRDLMALLCDVARQLFQERTCGSETGPKELVNEQDLHRAAPACVARTVRNHSMVSDSP